MSVEVGELQALLEELAGELGRSVVINDPLVRVLCTSRHYGDEDPLRVRAVLQHDAGPAASRFILDQGVSRWSAPGMLQGSDEIGMHPRLCVPLRERGELLGLLMVIDAEHTLTPTETARIGDASRSVAALLAREQASGDARRRERHSAVRMLLSADPAARDRALRTHLTRAASSHRHGTVALCVRVEAAAVGPAEAGSALRGVLDSVVRNLGDRALGAGSDFDAALVLAQSHTQSTASDVAARIVEGLDRLLPRAGLSSVGLGEPVADLTLAYRSFSQAQIAVRAARLTPASPAVVGWQDLGPYAPLLTVAELGLDSQAIPHQVRALLAHDKGPRLAETARVFLDQGGSIPKTAAVLHLHRSTLYYRFARIREVTGLDLDDGRDRAVLHIGLLLADLLPAPPPDPSPN